MTPHPCRNAGETQTSLRGGLIGAERATDLVDRGALLVADALVALGDLLGQREDEAPVAVDLLGARLGLEHLDRLAQLLARMLLELVERMEPRVVALGLRRDDLVEQPALPVLL